MSNLSDPLQMRPFELADAAFVTPWLGESGLSAPPKNSAWPERLLRDDRILAMVAHASGVPAGGVRLDGGPDGIAEITIVVAP